MGRFNHSSKNAVFACIVLVILFFNGIDSRAGIRDSLKASYESQIGVRELTGNNDGIEVESYLSTCGLNKGYAWCAAFVNWNFEQVGIETGVHSSVWSPSWFVDSSKVVYRKTWQKTDYKSESGQVFGLYFSSKGRVAHVGFIYAENLTSYFTVEGNTNKAGSREGDGVYRKVRSKNTVYIVSDYVRDREKSEQKAAIEWRRNTIYFTKGIAEAGSTCHFGGRYWF